MSTQPEQVLENQLIEQLSNQGYSKVSIPDETSLLTNLKAQLEKHNNITFTTKEFERVLNILSKGSAPVLLKHMSDKHPNKFKWFIDAEKNPYGKRTLKIGMKYKDIKKSLKQTKLFDDDFNECDSGYCGL